MKEVPVHNKHEYAIHVGNKTIPPGETRMVDESMLPDAAQRINSDVAEVEDQSDPLLDLLDLSTPDLTEKLAGLSRDELDLLEQAENDGNTRSGAIKAIAEARLVLVSAEADSSTGEADNISNTKGDSGDGSSAGSNNEKTE